MYKYNIIGEQICSIFTLREKINWQISIKDYTKKFVGGIKVGMTKLEKVIRKHLIEEINDTYMLRNL